MKKHALALAILATPVVVLADAPVLYGKFNVTLENVDSGATDQWQLGSNASRLGIKGEAESGVTGVKVLYLAEFGLDVDEGVGASNTVRNSAGTGTTTINQVFSQRNIYGGLKGGFGTLRFGRIDTPLKDAQGKVDQFNDLAGDIQNLVGGETRASNILYYTSPKLAGSVTLNAAVSPAEGTNVDGKAGNEDGIADSISASAVYEKGAFYLALAYDQSQPISGFTADNITRADIVRVVGTWKGDKAEAGILLQSAEAIAPVANAGNEDQGWLVSGAYNIDKWKLKAQYGANDDARTLAALGADYKFGKSTTLFGYAAKAETDAGQPVTLPPVSAPLETTTLALGFDHRF